MQDEKARSEVVGWAGGPDVLQGEGGTTSADLPKGELAAPGVADGKGGEDLFMEKLMQANRDVDFPDEQGMFCGIEAGRESSEHVGRPRGGEGGELGAEEQRGGRGNYHVSEDG